MVDTGKLRDMADKIRGVGDAAFNMEYAANTIDDLRAQVTEARRVAKLIVGYQLRGRFHVGRYGGVDEAMELVESWPTDEGGEK